MSGSHSHVNIVNALLTIHSDRVTLWKQLKSVRLPTSVQSFNILTHKLLYGGEEVYGNANRRNAFCFDKHGESYYGSLYFAFTHTDSSSSPNIALVLVLVMHSASLDHGNTHVHDKFHPERMCFSTLSHVHIHFKLIPGTDLLRPAMIVIDSIWVKRR